jgi:hypothetical protein
MFGHLRRNVVAYVALFFALGGVGYAAAKIPRNSVGNAQLKRNAVTSSKVKNGTLTAADFAKGVIKAGPAGPQGPQGATGPTGPTGPAGPGAKLLTADPTPGDNTPHPLGTAGPYTLYGACQSLGGGTTIQATPAISGPAGHWDIATISASDAPFSASVDIPAASSPVQFGPTMTASGTTTQATSWTTAHLSAGGTTVAVQWWVSANLAGGGHAAACHFSASVTPLSH